jgi:hypothetical protein
MLPPSSALKNKSSKKLAQSREQVQPNVTNGLKT